MLYSKSAPLLAAQDVAQNPSTNPAEGLLSFGTPNSGPKRVRCVMDWVTPSRGFGELLQPTAAAKRTPHGVAVCAGPQVTRRVSDFAVFHSEMLNSHGEVVDLEAG